MFYYLVGDKIGAEDPSLYFVFQILITISIRC